VQLNIATDRCPLYPASQLELKRTQAVLIVRVATKLTLLCRYIHRLNLLRVCPVRLTPRRSIVVRTTIARFPLCQSQVVGELMDWHLHRMKLQQLHMVQFHLLQMLLAEGTLLV
jgi:hypothetical protein